MVARMLSKAAFMAGSIVKMGILVPWVLVELFRKSNVAKPALSYLESLDLAWDTSIRICKHSDLRVLDSHI